jgi:hypothetical protein
VGGARRTRTPRRRRCRGHDVDRPEAEAAHEGAQVVGHGGRVVRCGVSAHGPLGVAHAAEVGREHRVARVHEEREHAVPLVPRLRKAVEQQDGGLHTAGAAARVATPHEVVPHAVDGRRVVAEPRVETRRADQRLPRERLHVVARLAGRGAGGRRAQRPRAASGAWRLTAGRGGEGQHGRPRGCPRGRRTDQAWSGVRAGTHGGLGTGWDASGGATAAIRSSGYAASDAVSGADEVTAAGASTRTRASTRRAARTGSRRTGRRRARSSRSRGAGRRSVARTRRSAASEGLWTEEVRPRRPRGGGTGRRRPRRLRMRAHARGSRSVWPALVRPAGRA